MLQVNGNNNGYKSKYMGMDVYIDKGIKKYYCYDPEKVSFRTGMTRRLLELSRADFTKSGVHGLENYCKKILKDFVDKDENKIASKITKSCDHYYYNYLMSTFYNFPEIKMLINSCLFNNGKVSEELKSTELYKTFNECLFQILYTNHEKVLDKKDNNKIMNSNIELIERLFQLKVINPEFGIILI